LPQQEAEAKDKRRMGLGVTGLANAGEALGFRYGSEEFLAFVNFMFGTSNTAIFEGQAEYTVLFGRELSAFEQVLLNYVSTSQGYPSRLIPKTVGVKINFGWFLTDSYFGFQGAPGALGFGEFVGTFGYGLGYGVGYGDSDFSQAGGGTFATLF